MDVSSPVFNDIRNLLLSHNLGVLATAGERYPYTSLVGFIVTDDLRTLIFATLRDTRKFQGLTKNPDVSFLVTSQRNNMDDFKDADALTVLGAARPIESDTGMYKTLFLQKFPFLKHFIEDPNCSLVAITVHRYIWVTRFQEVTEITCAEA